jgi:hypothetical protein
MYIDAYEGNLIYLAPVVVADAILAYIALRLVTRNSAKFLKLGRNLSLAAMFIALLGFLVAPLV